MDSSSVSSFSSLDNVSRSSMLKRQREAALRRRQNQMPVRKDSYRSDGGRSVSNPMSSMTTSAMADVLRWEETKTRDRIEARVKKEEEESRMRAEIVRAAEAEAKAETARRAELERFEQEQFELKRELAEEQKSREEVAQRLEAEARRLAEVEVERLEKDRLGAEAAKRAERLEKELKQERLERERLDIAERAKDEGGHLAERVRVMEQQSMERQFSAPFQENDTNGSVNHSRDVSFERKTHPPSNNGYYDSNAMRVGKQQVPPSQMYPQPTTACNEEAYGQFSHAMKGSDNGYQRYLSTQQIGEDDSTAISESTGGNSLYGSTAVLQAEKNTTLPTSNNTEMRGFKMKRSISTRSLSFNEINEADQSTNNQGTTDDTKRLSNAQPESSKQDAHDVITTPKECTNSVSNKNSPLRQMASVENVNLDDPKVMRSFLMNPCPKGEGMIQCCVRRNKSIKNALFPEYRIYLKSNNSKTETFLMTSKKRVGNKTSNYLISMSRNDHDKNSDGILGKLRSNFLGTEYMIYDQGRNPDDDDCDGKNDGDIRCELGVILYAASTSLGSKGPRKMKVCVSKVDENGNPPKVWQPTNKNDERMVSCFKKESYSLDKLACLENKPPSWNEEVGAYVLNFNGRVTMASVKNFQLYAQNDKEDQIMQFGRIGKDDFTMDVSYPLSPMQAFAIAMSSFDSKLGCD
mmetsp:Transcript_7893/g.17770  ORF Transcript_7893/g.17770 Transcript_7893/m.17770 type:complete len:692 (+) Transcript_7893:1036-3111(+)